MNSKNQRKTDQGLTSRVEKQFLTPPRTSRSLMSQDGDMDDQASRLNTPKRPMTSPRITNPRMTNNQLAPARAYELKVAQEESTVDPQKNASSKTRDIVEYRRKLFKEFEKFQREYYDRMKQRGFNISQLDLNNNKHVSSSDEKFMTVYPPVPNFSTNLHKLVKVGEIFKRVQRRYFLLDNENLIYFKNEKDRIAKGYKSLLNCNVFLQDKTQSAQNINSSKWIESDKEYRVTIKLQNKRQPTYVYFGSDELDAAKALIVKIKLTSRPQLQSTMQEIMPMLSFHYRINLFRSFWKTIKQVQKKRRKDQKAFQKFGKVLLKVSVQNWQRNRRMLQFFSQNIESQITFFDLKPQGLVSSFRSGRPRPQKKRIEFNISYILLHRLHQLKKLVLNRRIFRKPHVSNQIKELLSREFQGFYCNKIELESSHNDSKDNTLISLDQSPKRQVEDKSCFEIADNCYRIAFEPHTPDSMLIEQLSPQKASEHSFFSKQFMRRVDLRKISMVATDLDSFLKTGSAADQDKQQQEFQIKIYGEASQPHFELSSANGNDAVEFFGLTPLNKKIEKQELLEIKVISIELPVSFLRRHNGKGFLRIKYLHGLGAEGHANASSEQFQLDKNRSFGNVSKNFYLNVLNLEEKVKDLDEEDTFPVPLPEPIVFTLKPVINQMKEQFSIKLTFSANVCPIPSIIKDYMVETVFENKLSGGRIQGNTLRYEVFAEQQGKAFIFMKFKKIKNCNKSDFLAGPRILIGRFCLLDGQNPMQITSYNAAQETFTLNNLRGSQGNTIKDVPLSRIKRIERYGVSVYDINNLPEQIQRSKFKFIWTICTRDRLLLTSLLRKIQETHVRLSFANVQQIEKKSLAASGNLHCSVIEANNLYKSLAVQKICKANNKAAVKPYVKISIEHIKKDQQPQPISGQPISTAVILEEDVKKQRAFLKRASWVSAENPTGSLHDLGEFKMSRTSLSKIAQGQDMTEIASHQKQQLTINRRSTTWLNVKDAKRRQVQPDEELKYNEDGESSHGMINPDEIYIRFQILNNGQAADQPQHALLGQSLVQASKFIDLQEPQKTIQLLLLLPADHVKRHLNRNEILTDDRMFAGTLCVQTLFVPDRVTRWNFDMYNFNSEITNPEAVAHLNQLLQPQIFDSYHYLVPTERYNPLKYQKGQQLKQQSGSRPRILVGKDMLKVAMQDLQRTLEDTNMRNEKQKHFLLKELTALSMKKNLFTSSEETNDYFMWTINNSRPIQQEFSANFMNRWLAITAQNNYEAKKRLNRFLWQQFIIDLIKSGATNFPDEGFSAEDSKSEMDDCDQDSQGKSDEESSIIIQQDFRAQNPSNSQIAEDYHIYLDSIRGNEEIKSRSFLPQSLGFGFRQMLNLAKQKQAKNELKILQHAKVNLFRDRRIWEQNKSCQQFADLYYLILQGVPDEFRVRVWKDLLRTEQAEQESIAPFQETFPQVAYDQNLSLYHNYLRISQDYDSLAFRQIDEDIYKYAPIDSYLLDCKTSYERDLILRAEKSSLRNILRALILWSKQSIEEESLDASQASKYRSFSFSSTDSEGKKLTQPLQKKSHVISYSTGFLQMIQRLNTITQSEQDCFSIVAGIIRCNPRPFSVESSILLENCEPMMRYEMTALKTMVEHSLPKVYSKLKAFGLPIELLTYHSLTSFYARDFSTEVIHRLWDIMIFFLSSPQVEDRKRGLWWLLSPAFLIFQEKSEEICACLSCEDVISIYKAGSAITYDPDWFVDKIKEINFKIFVEGKVKQTTVMQKLVQSSIEIENAFAHKFEQKRAMNMSKLTQLFNQTKHENEAVNEMMQKANLQLADDGTKKESIVTSFATLSQKITTGMNKILDNYGKDAQFDRSRRSTVRVPSAPSPVVSLKQQTQINQEKINHQFLKEITQHLPLSRIYIYVQSFSTLNQKTLQGARLRIQYGKIDPQTGIFISAANSPSKELKFRKNLKFGTEKFIPNSIELLAQFNYLSRNNYIRLQLLEGQLQILSKVIPLIELPFNRFMERRLLALGPLKTRDDSDHIQIQFSSSFFLQSLQEESKDSSSFNTRSMIGSFLRKRPDLVDIFEVGKSNYDQMIFEFEKLVKQEFNQIRSVLGQNTALEIINDAYNYVETAGDYGKVSFTQFRFLAQSLLPKAMNSDIFLNKIFQVYAGDSKTDSKKALSSKQTNFYKKQAKLETRERIEETPQKNEAAAFDAQAFQLGKFFITCILMSQSTVEEKLSLIYDFYVKISSQSADLMPSIVSEIISIIFDRNLYFWPAQELQNQIEHIFTESIGSIQGAYWTNDLSLLEGWRNDIQDNAAINRTVYDNESNADHESGSSDSEELGQENLINVTAEAQKSIMRYCSVFGTKIIDFNNDVSPFRNLQALVGNKKAKKLLHMATKHHEKQFSLVLFSMTEGERFSYILNYSNKNGVLQSCQGQQYDINQNKVKTTIQSILKRECNKLSLSGMTRPISKQEFLEKVEQIPFFTNLIRVETFWQDRLIKNVDRTSLARNSQGRKSELKKPMQSMQLKTPVNMSVFVTFYANGNLFVFRFQQRQNRVIEGETVNQDKLCFRFEMNALCEQDTISDARNRISSAMVKAHSCTGQRTQINTQLKVFGDVIGSRDIYILSQQDQPADSFRWKLIPNDFLRFSNLSDSESYQRLLILKLESSRLSTIAESYQMMESTASYDSHAFYKHSDQSYDWMPCKIIARHLKKELLRVQNVTLGPQCFEYQVAFLHLALKDDSSTVSRNVFIRSADEILFSATYTREFQRNFEQECLNYIRTTYNQGNETLTNYLRQHGYPQLIQSIDDYQSFELDDDQTPGERVSHLSKGYQNEDSQTISDESQNQHDYDRKEYNQKLINIRHTEEIESSDEISAKEDSSDFQKSIEKSSSKTKAQNNQKSQYKKNLSKEESFNFDDSDSYQDEQSLDSKISEIAGPDTFRIQKSLL